MLAVPLSEDAIQPFLNEKLSLAGINSPSRCVISGEEEDISNLRNELTHKNIIAKDLHTSHAFHSNMMEPILDKFAQEIGQITLQSIYALLSKGVPEGNPATLSSACPK